MKKDTNLNHGIFRLFIVTGFILVLSACNKDIPGPKPIVHSPINNSTTSLGSIIDTDTTYSFFKAAATRVGALTSLNDINNVFTIFLPNNDAFRISGIPSEAVIGVLPIQTVGAIVQYHIIPGQQYTSAEIPETFPNIQLPSSLTIGQLPGTTIPLKMSIFPSRRGGSMWVNNIPVITPDLKFQNGVIHLVAAIVSPPSQVLRDALYSNPDLTYFKAAVARADSGQTGLSRLDSLLNYAVTNMTILAPNDAAFKTLLFGSIYGALLAQGADPATAQAQAGALSASPTVFENPLLFPVLTAATVRGILAYHFLASPNPVTSAFEPNIRVFSVNFPPLAATPFFVQTLVNSSFAPHPGIIVAATFTGPFVTNLNFTGLGTFPPGGAPYSGGAATAVSLDKHAVNGVYYVLDKVLLPQ
ncbi:MAG: fasciclin domain-containing protein [Ginsengibacter sp.]